MSTGTFLERVQRSIDRADLSYCKHLAPNDTGATNSHQRGILLSRGAWRMFFPDGKPDRNLTKREINIRWPDGSVTESAFTWYESKHELRLTRFRGHHPLGPGMTGDLFVLTRQTPEDYEAWIVSDDDEVDELAANNNIPAQAGWMLFTSAGTADQTEKASVESEIRKYVDGLGLGPDTKWPTGREIAKEAEDIQERAEDHTEWARTMPDQKLLDWIRVEYQLFRGLESSAYLGTVRRGFASVDDFVKLANSLLNQRKSRAGKSLELHLGSLFSRNGLAYEPQIVTEGNKKPDFCFPSAAAYHDSGYPVDRLTILAVKTTCKDRWRQILTEADRMNGRTHYLLTLQNGNSPAQLREMESENVQLVVPKEYHIGYPPEYRDKLWSVRQFIDYVRETEKAPD